VAAEIDGSTYLWLRQKMAEAGVRVLLEHSTTMIDDGGLTARASFSGIEQRLDADLVVGFSERESNGKMLAETLRRRMPVRQIGDARVPRDAAAAIREGYAAAIELDRW
jgi:hypothetical protein